VGLRRRIYLVTGLLVGAAALVISSVNMGHAGPTVASPAPVPSPSAAAGGNVEIDPPPTGFQPSITADQAVGVAEQQLADPSAVSSITSIQPQLASFSWDATPVDEEGNPTGPPIYTNVPAWVITVNGPCTVVSPTLDGTCASITESFVVDATTGNFIMGFVN